MSSIICLVFITKVGYWFRGTCYNLIDGENVKGKAKSIEKIVSTPWNKRQHIYLLTQPQKSNSHLKKKCVGSTSISRRHFLPPKWQTQETRSYMRLSSLVGLEMQSDRSRLVRGNTTLLSILMLDCSWNTNLNEEHLDLLPGQMFNVYCRSVLLVSFSYSFMCFIELWSTQFLNYKKFTVKYFSCRFYFPSII